MKNFITYFHKDYYISEIKKLSFHIPYVIILGKNYCGKLIWGALNSNKKYNYIKFTNNVPIYLFQYHKNI